MSPDENDLTEIDFAHGAKNPDAICRRKVLAAIAGLGIGSTAWQRALAAQVTSSGIVTVEMVREAEWISGLELTDEERQQTARSLRRTLRNFDALRSVEVAYDVAPALAFSVPQPEQTSVRTVIRNQARPAAAARIQRPESDDDLAFLSVAELSSLLRTRQMTSLELTELYLSRLRRFDPLLKCVVSYTEDVAFAQAKRADSEIASGRFRGPLHGIPWGAKDLMAWPGYKTTWGAPPFRDQIIDKKATVARRLEEAGAVMIAKLSLGALASGDKWFGGQTRNPWNPEQGSSGSSAGSSAAVAAGLVGFAIGSETNGSIISPCRRCGASGLRPTFGRVSRHGCMPLAWSMDKIGPIARGVDDCALIFDAIHGADGLDETAVDHPFNWPMTRDPTTMRVGFLKTEVDEAERRDLEILRKLGVTLVPIELPSRFPIPAMLLMLGTEAATVFDGLTRDHVTAGLNSWPDTFRRGQFIPAVEYLRAARLRKLLQRELDEVFRDVDVYVTGTSDLTMTNLTGHPKVVLPFSFLESQGHRAPGTMTFTGRFFGETDLLGVAHRFQRELPERSDRPPLEEFRAADKSNSESAK